MDYPGWLNFLIFFLTFGGIYAIFALALNIQWGYCGQFNIGINAFWAIGAYAAAIMTTRASPDYLGGFELPFLAGMAVAAALAGVLALLIGLITVNLRTDYLAIATIGIAEIVRLTIRNEAWLTNGAYGISNIPSPVDALGSAGQGVKALSFLLLVLITIGLIYFVSERARRAPWGRVLRAIRENEPATQASGKNVMRFRLEAFVLGAAVMGIGGALYAYYTRFVGPLGFTPLKTTFLIWVMLIAGGSGNNRGAILGAFAVWGIWSGTDLVASQFPAQLAPRISPARILLIGVLLQVVLLTRPQGILPERPPKPVVGAGRGEDKPARP